MATDCHSPPRHPTSTIREPACDALGMDSAIDDAHAVVLVEGSSDRAAVEALAERRGLDLQSESVAVVPIGGATNIARFLPQYGPRGSGVRVVGLCDVGEERAYRRGLERAGFGTDLTRPQMERLGFYVCDKDLEDELIRALGAPAVERVIEAAGELDSFRILQRQPAQRDRLLEDQLRRFIGTRAGRKIRYGRLLVEALDLDRVPRPLDGVLAAAISGAAPNDAA
jgi:hypothetical protein